MKVKKIMTRLRALCAFGGLVGIDFLKEEEK